MNVGDAGEATLVVGPVDSARSLGLEPGDDFPEVFATSRMVALDGARRGAAHATGSDR
jgi:hypothetical protein